MYLKRILSGLMAVLLVAAAVMGGCAHAPETGLLQMRMRGERQVFIEYNQPYVEAGAYAAVKTGGETVSLPVQISGDTVDTGKLGTYLLKYTAVDAGRVTTNYRRVHVVDTQSPQLQLNGAQYYTMSVGQPYAELGCLATDNYDGDLSKRVQVTGTVDRMNPGEYVLTYTVTDSNHNTSQVKRTVCVEEWGMDVTTPVYFGEPNGKVIYLTFDDGPGKYTHQLLDVLKRYNVKATFFVVDTGFDEEIKRIAAEGHTLALHTSSHVYKEIYASEEAYFKDLYALQDKVKALTGQVCTMIRFPGGSSNKSSSFNPGIMIRLTKLVQEKGFTYYDWTLDSKDSVGAKTALEVYNNVTSGIGRSEKNYAIVLQHDIKGYSVEAVEAIILWGLEHGYTFMAMDENTPQYHHNVRN